MDSEIPLPPPRRIRHRSPAPNHSAGTAFSFQRAQRLSRFDDRSSQPSSDPALFSSDDIPASGLENYHATVSGAGRKRRYRGTWWGEQVIDPKRKRADFKDKRNVDSGVWMGSDESGAESLLASEDGSTWGEDLRKSVLDPRKSGSSTPFIEENTPAPTRVAFRNPEESDAHRFAREVVSDCLDKGHESIDLGDFHLRTIPSGLLRPLQHLTKLPSVREAPVSENVFTSLQPFLHIYLPNNSLSDLHNDLFELSNIKVLSLRNNKLTEIPSTIRRLTALEVLNLSVNQLSYFPWEILRLMQQGELKHLTVRPNPFIPIEEAQIAEWHYNPNNEKETENDETENDEDSSPPLQFQEQESSPNEGWAPLHVATGPITYMDMEGNPIEDSSSGKRGTLTPSVLTSVNNAPSLREVALRAVSKLPYLEQTTDEELSEYPALIVPLLQQAREVRIAGGQLCSVCQREYVIPRTEWMEWWDFTPCLGLSLARAVQSNGHKVIATSRQPSRTPELVSEITQNGGEWHTLDVDNATAAAELLSTLESAGHKIDVLVNNAGYAILGAVEQFSDEEVRAQMETVYFGPSRLIRAIVPGMRERRFGIVVNVSSGAGLEGRERMGAYAAAKAAMDGLCKVLAKEVAPFNVRFLTVWLGVFNTQFGAGCRSPVNPLPVDYVDSVATKMMDAIQSGKFVADGDKDKAAKAIYEVVVGEGVGVGRENEEFLPLGRDMIPRIELVRDRLVHTLDVFGDIAGNVYVEKE
ncbi:Short-chain dehydrogenase/reductase SDR [Penicillium griseofulvum]|uniref:Short-chain dehydrogenase/reductase SDR n=1 Tax=Penicillium patulum TaxID=5078 RepID=A0A135LIE9_PENPA|nr:Short-chain dehydrogenase/reductase SDR [Penicillium griseofulvum]KXG48745.1 Short-chain dehydrogenase/reductase SDR [Penicillium griseofulvum]